LKGKIRKWLDFRGYGFIKPEKENDDIFVHISSFKAEDYYLIKEGLEVEFDVKKTYKGLEAENVRIPVQIEI